MRARIRAGEPEAFRELFADQARSVYNHAFRLVGSWSTAEEVVSLTFLEAWRLRDRVDVDDDGGSLRPWLLGIATNVARNVRRAARRYEAAMARLPKAELVADFADEVADRVSDRVRLAQVRRALAGLRQSEREVLALCVWSGLDYAEAATALGVPIGTVRSRLSRARKKLNELVEAGGLAPPARPDAGEIGPHARAYAADIGPPARVAAAQMGPPDRKWELPVWSGQVIGDRENAVLLAQEKPR